MPRSAYRLRPVVLLISLALLGAGAAGAGTVYVPLPGISTVGTASWEAELTLANPSGTPATVKGVWLTGDTDGVARVGAFIGSAEILAGRTALNKPGATFRGMVELSGSPNVRYLGRLTGKTTVGVMGVALPVVTSENLAPAAGKLTLQGLTKSATRATHIGVINLGKVAGECSLSLVKADGGALGAAVVVPMKPLSQVYRADVFAGLVDAAGVADARALVSCNREFFAYAVLTDTATGEVSVIEPSGSGESLLTLPGEDAPCPPTATCLANDQLFTPTPATPVRRVVFTPPPGTYKRLELSVDVTVGNFFAAQPDGKHLIIWFVKNRNRDMPGMVYFRGTGNPMVLVRWGIGLTHPQKFKMFSDQFVPIPGHTYRVVNDFDMARGVYTVTVTDNGTGQVVTLTDAPGVAQLNLGATDKLLIDQGFPEGVFDEVPSYGWTYARMRLVATR